MWNKQKAVKTETTLKENLLQLSRLTRPPRKNQKFTVMTEIQSRRRLMRLYEKHKYLSKSAFARIGKSSSLG